MADTIDRRACDLAVYIIETGATVRTAAKHFGISKSTVHKDVTDRLMQIKVGDIPVDYQYLNVGSDFFTVLDFGVISGDPKRILSNEGLANNEVMISERLATTLFGKPLSTAMFTNI